MMMALASSRAAVQDAMSAKEAFSDDVLKFLALNFESVVVDLFALQSSNFI